MRFRLRLTDLGFVARGKSRHRPRNDASLYGGTYPFIQTGDVKEADLWLTKYTQTYNEAGLAQSKVWPKGTLCITIAANIAETAILGMDSCFPDSIVGFTPNPTRADARYIKYFIDTIKLRMQNISRGTTQDNLSVEKLLTFDFNVPDVAVQRSIADILSAYDDLIENNARRINILEQMAQMLYREWFVNFRFPGHKKVKMVESEFGMIPQGWSAQSVGAVSQNFDSKRKPLSSIERSTRKGQYPYYGAATIFDFIDDFIFDGVFLLVGEDGSVITPDNKPVLQLTDGKFWPNNHTHVIQGKAPISTYYLYLCLSDADVAGCVTGAAQPKITQANLNRIPVVVPTAQVLNKFDGLVTPMLLERALFEKRNKNLRTTRDLLLPKLVSGEIEIPEAKGISESVIV